MGLAEEVVEEAVGVGGSVELGVLSEPCGLGPVVEAIVKKEEENGRGREEQVRDQRRSAELVLRAGIAKQGRLCVV